MHSIQLQVDIKTCMIENLNVLLEFVAQKIEAFWLLEIKVHYTRLVEGVESFKHLIIDNLELVQTVLTCKVIIFQDLPF